MKDLRFRIRKKLAARGPRRAVKNAKKVPGKGKLVGELGKNTLFLKRKISSSEEGRRLILERGRESGPESCAGQSGWGTSRQGTDASKEPPGPAPFRLGDSAAIWLASPCPRKKNRFWKKNTTTLKKKGDILTTTPYLPTESPRAVTVNRRNGSTAESFLPKRQYFIKGGDDSRPRVIFSEVSLQDLKKGNRSNATGPACVLTGSSLSQYARRQVQT